MSSDNQKNVKIAFLPIIWLCSFRKKKKYKDCSAKDIITTTKNSKEKNVAIKSKIKIR